MASRRSVRHCYTGNDAGDIILVDTAKEQSETGSRLVREYSVGGDVEWAAAMLTLAICKVVQFPNKYGGKSIIRFGSVPHGTS